jgi:DNA-directed RNA polymerase II subunit RPB2
MLVTLGVFTHTECMFRWGTYSWVLTLRVGEMERDAMISHGATGILIDRLMIVSDKYRAVFCRKCGNFSISNSLKKEVKCPIHGNDPKLFGTLTFPYIFKLIIHMLIMLGMNVVIKTDPSVKENSRPEERLLN